MLSRGRGRNPNCTVPRMLLPPNFRNTWILFQLLNVPSCLPLEGIAFQGSIILLSAYETLLYYPPSSPARPLLMASSTMRTHHSVDDFDGIRCQNPWVLEGYILGLWTMESCNEGLSLSHFFTDSEEITYGGSHQSMPITKRTGCRCSSVEESLPNTRFSISNTKRKEKERGKKKR